MMGEKVLNWFMLNYKKIFYIPFIITIISLFLLYQNYAQTGDIFAKDISLKGGLTFTFLTDKQVELSTIEAALEPALAPHEINVRELRSSGRSIGFIVESDLQSPTTENVQALILAAEGAIGEKLEKSKYSLESVGSSLGESFFQQTFNAMVIAFIFIGIVVFIIFRSLLPSFAVMLSTFSNIVTTMAVADLMGMRIGTAGIAAFLMLIGYSIDTEILLNTRMLKRGDESVRDCFASAFKTGMMMSITTLTAVTISLFFIQNEVIKQIMVILLIGLLADLFNTWLQNSSLILWHVERHEKKEVKA
ncbi:MAG: hypothetical protein Q7S65_01290 [Nanoarchaeota archaeon]|nr:hypothetical protein [Nanoarchaeota archaeon]